MFRCLIPFHVNYNLDILNCTAHFLSEETSIRHLATKNQQIKRYNKLFLIPAEFQMSYFSLSSVMAQTSAGGIQFTIIKVFSTASHFQEK